MSETTAKELKEKLFYKKENGTDVLSAEELKVCDEFCEGYKAFLYNCKTEREVSKWAEETAALAGFKPFNAFGA